MHKLLLPFLIALIGFHDSTFADDCVGDLHGQERRDRIAFVVGPLGQETRISTPERWPDTGLQASLRHNFQDFTKIEGIWDRYIGDQVPYSEHEARVSEIFDQITLSPNRHYAVTYSNYGHTRVYPTEESGQIHYGRATGLIKFTDHMKHLQDGVLAVSDQHFVIGEKFMFPDGVRREAITLRRLDEPEHVIWSHAVEAPLTSLIFNRSDTRLIFTTKTELFVYDIENQIAMPTFLEFPESHLEISTATLLKGSVHLVIGFNNPVKDAAGTYLLNVDVDEFYVSTPVFIEDITTIISLSPYDKEMISIQGRDHNSPLQKFWAELPEPHRYLTYKVLPMSYPSPH